METQKKSLKRKALFKFLTRVHFCKVVTEILDNNEQSIEDFKTVKTVQLALVGQIMKATKGQANPPLVNKILLEEINKR